MRNKRQSARPACSSRRKAKASNSSTVLSAMVDTLELELLVELSLADGLALGKLLAGLETHPAATPGAQGVGGIVELSAGHGLHVLQRGGVLHKWYIEGGEALMSTAVGCFFRCCCCSTTAANPELQA